MQFLEEALDGDAWSLAIFAINVQALAVCGSSSPEWHYGYIKGGEDSFENDHCLSLIIPTLFDDMSYSMLKQDYIRLYANPNLLRFYFLGVPWVFDCTVTLADGTMQDASCLNFEEGAIEVMCSKKEDGDWDYGNIVTVPWSRVKPRGVPMYDIDEFPMESSSEQPIVSPNVADADSQTLATGRK